MLSNAVVVGEKAFEFIMEDAVKISDRNLAFALSADVLGGASADIHFVAAGAMEEVSEDLHGDRN